MALKSPSDNTIHYDANFRQYVLENIDWLKANSTGYVELTYADTERWVGDFKGMLSSLTPSIPVELHWVTGVLNGIFDSTLFDGGVMTLNTVNRTQYQKLIMNYNRS